MLMYPFTLAGSILSIYISFLNKSEKIRTAAVFIVIVEDSIMTSQSFFEAFKKTWYKECLKLETP